MSKELDSNSVQPTKHESAFNLIDIEDIERPVTEDEYIAVYRRNHPELEKEEKKLEKDAKKKIDTFKPVKLLGFNAKRIEHTYFDEKGKRIAFIQERKRKPYSIDVKILPDKFKKNPDKDILASVGIFPNKKQIFRYKSNSDDVYMSSGVDYFKVDINELYQMLLQILFRTLSEDILAGKLLDADYYLQFMSKSKLPHLKLKDWRKSGRVNVMTMEDINKAFEQHQIDTENERKALGK